jgi:hypothetical protein
MSGPSPDTYVDGARFAFRDEFEEDIRQDPLSGSAAISPEKLNNKLRCFKVLGLTAGLNYDPLVYIY